MATVTTSSCFFFCEKWDARGHESTTSHIRSSELLSWSSRVTLSSPRRPSWSARWSRCCCCWSPADQSEVSSEVTWPAVRQSELTSLPDPELLVLMLRWPHCPDSDVTLQLSRDNILDSLLKPYHYNFCQFRTQKCINQSMVKTWGRWLWWQSRVSFFFPRAVAPSDQDFPPSSWWLLLFPGKYELW